jgi:hypothetical protein
VKLQMEKEMMSLIVASALAEVDPEASTSRLRV